MVRYLLYLSVIAITTGCAAKGEEKKETATRTASRSYSSTVEDDDEDVEDTDAEDGDDDHHFKDGTHSATVEYYNPETGTQSTYTLDVEVENSEVTTIYFPKGGWLDDTHINSAEIDEDGSATLVDDEGREFEVQLDDE